MKNAKYLTLLVVALIFSLSSCKDDKDEPTPISAKTEFLTAKMWKVSKLDFNGEDVSKYPEVENERSTKIKFDKNGTYKQTRNNGEETGKWKFTDNETNLRYGPNTTDQDDWQIVELTENSFIANTVFTYEDGPLDVRVEMVPAQ